MRRASEYGFFLIGLPNVIAFAIVAWLASVFLLARPSANRRVLLSCVDILSGVTSVFAAVMIARWFGFDATPWLPVASAAWFAIHFACRHRFAEVVRASVGVLSGWWLYVTLSS